MAKSRSSSRTNLIKTAAAACRVPIFSPTRGRSNAVFRHHVSTSWGSAVITGRLDQRHRDVLDAVIDVNCGGRKASIHGDMALLVDSAVLRRRLGWSRWRYSHIIEILRDLRAAEVELQPCRQGKTEWTGIITHIRESHVPPPPRRGSLRTEQLVPDPGRPDIRGGAVWEITVSGAWIELMRRLPTVYAPAVLSMRYGVSQALARFMLSHDSPRMPIDTALCAIGVDSRQARHRARGDLEIERETLATVGVLIEGDWVSCSPESRAKASRSVPETGAGEVISVTPNPISVTHSPGDVAPSPGNVAPSPGAYRNIDP